MLLDTCHASTRTMSRRAGLLGLLGFFSTGERLSPADCFPPESPLTARMCCGGDPRRADECFDEVYTAERCCDDVTAPEVSGGGARQAPSGEGGDGAELLWSAFLHVTGFSTEQLTAVAEELLRLPPPSQRGVWTERVHCSLGQCAGEAAARLLSALGEGGVMPLRSFEPHKGDPLYNHWNAEDKQVFHSWVDGEAADLQAPLWTLVPEGQSLVLPRRQAAEFMSRVTGILDELLGSTVGAVGRCLEWDTPFYVVKGLGRRCTYYDVFTYPHKEAGQEEQMRDYPKGSRWISADLLNLPPWAPGDYGVVACLFVLEHVVDPHAAARGLFRLLAPGGFLLLGAPFIDGVHACPDDYFRFTPSGLRYVAEAAGFEVLWTFSPGGHAVAAGEFLGMKSSYWSPEDVAAESDTHPLNVFLLARKPGSRIRRGPRWANLTVAAVERHGHLGDRPPRAADWA